MSDFVISKKEERTSEAKTVSFVKTTKKELRLVLQTVVFLTSFFGLIYLSISNNNLMLSEILVVGGILSLIFLIHILSNR